MCPSIRTDSIVTAGQFEHYPDHMYCRTQASGPETMPPSTRRPTTKLTKQPTKQPTPPEENFDSPVSKGMNRPSETRPATEPYRAILSDQTLRYPLFASFDVPANGIHLCQPNDLYGLSQSDH
ncbi:hypothetical protein BO71DRAFT_26231 [Aspergillus ellipticus CBS 707.79]|uniref:Uncharacterized protein n=1 Tax=Aspergillus ellipticus CBS 707.79 TaxID=1448320 RepID=A0A319D4T0_9EURO|nr:hypothetical protein BO71DRAFT_26231 [Aspergillus ellipticus CBS 707.79]